MNRSRAEKCLFYFLLLASLILLPVLSRDAGISGDEKVHHEHSLKVLDYYSSLGKDRAAINTPVTNLKFYGQSFDNGITLLGRIFNVGDIYAFRHFCNSLAGWLIILFAALLALHFSGYKASIFTILLLLASPRFVGHSFNNLKDIPFALGYIASLYFMVKLFDSLKQIRVKQLAGLVFSMAFLLSIRPGGLLVFCYLLLFSGLAIFREYKKEGILHRNFSGTIITIFVVLVSAYFLGLLFWPYALENPFLHPFRAMKVMSQYPVTLTQLFEGKIFWSDQLPWYYLLKYVAITIPLVIFPLITACIISLFRKKRRGLVSISEGLIIFSVLFPFVYTLAAGSNVYGAWRHLLFIYPPLVVLAALGMSEMLTWGKTRMLQISFMAVFFVLLSGPVRFMIRNHPLEYIYFNRLASDYQKISENYEMDYYYHSVRQASDWLNDYMRDMKLDSVKIASDYNTGEYFTDSPRVLSFRYVPYNLRGNLDWDFGIFYRSSVTPFQTKQHFWPPAGTLKTIDVEGIPVCAIVKRQSRDDYQGKLAYDREEYLEAEKLLLAAGKSDPGNENIWINLGKTYLKLESDDAARAAFNQCLEIIPGYEPALYYLSELELSRNNFDEAEKLYRKIISVNNKSFNTYITFAKLKMRFYQYPEALEILDQCLELNPSYREAIALKDQLMEKMKAI